MKPKVYDWFERPENKGTKCTVEEGKTRQSEAHGADINLIIKKYEQTGLWPERREGTFMNLSSMPSYQEALGQVAKARETFMQLPPEVRAVFRNDPAVMLDAWNEGSHAEVFERMGWLEKLPAAPAGEKVVPPKAGSDEGAKKS